MIPNVIFKWSRLFLVFISFVANGGNNYPDFYQQQTYRQVIKDFVLARCLAQVADKQSQFSSDAARSASALLEWVPFDIENGNDKINALIDKYKRATNTFHSERKPTAQGVTLNCLRLYHSDELEQLIPQIIMGNPERSWIQDNPRQ
ncbi:type VI secretion system amidase immunity protein Tai4 [Citrobacter sp. Awk 4]|uniref:T6SS amidase immunity protein Tai4 family protein n=1 Tax=Citrobacter sp. Awk 4 TaxID=2963955 RepID=UPI00230432FC|nr:T6SS amidase immunity protein Tai4 family protein [Citrobacter sp. Awk 4]MDA8477508.1 type VI secretion system amidase immunity protein Tai4 [Citrobacter sp. Awk 4]